MRQQNAVFRLGNKHYCTGQSSQGHQGCALNETLIPNTPAEFGKWRFQNHLLSAWWWWCHTARCPQSFPFLFLSLWWCKQVSQPNQLITIQLALERLAWSWRGVNMNQAPVPDEVPTQVRTANMSVQSSLIHQHEKPSSLSGANNVWSSAWR